MGEGEGKEEKEEEGKGNREERRLLPRPCIDGEALSGGIRTILRSAEEGGVEEERDSEDVHKEMKAGRTVRCEVQ